jgi:hypothetical protein
MSNNNPFDFFQSLMNQETMSKAMKSMPNMDFTSFGSSVKESADILTSTGQLISESLQSVAKRGADSFQKNTSQMFNTMKEAISAGDIGQINHCQQNYLKTTVENNINNTKEILDITSKSSREVLDVIGKNLVQNVGKSFTKGKE